MAEPRRLRSKRSNTKRRAGEAVTRSGSESPDAVSQGPGHTLSEEAAVAWLARTGLSAAEGRERWLDQHGQGPSTVERFAAVNRADQLALKAIAVANALVDPTTPSDAVDGATAWLDKVYEVDELKRDTMVWMALVEAIEEALAIRRKLSTGRKEPAPGSPPPPSLKSLANWVPAKVAARLPWARHVDWLHHTEAIERTLALCERRLSWKALNDLARECGAQAPNWGSLKAQYSKRKAKRRSP